ncbi:MAG TPA: carboxypeptidase regulatory-like domain-containing protein [Thermoanaerobaculia bacterium]|nr:carboxypeptidase regulatory-like domain-containing protein [Thermoanaerobaculia bacterium]
MFKKLFMALLAGLLMMIVIGCGGGGETAAYYEEEVIDGDAAQTAGATGPEAAGGTAPTAGGATLSGTIQFAGTPKANPVLQMGADPSCQAAHSTPVHAEEFVVGENGGLGNVFVWVKDFRGGVPAPSTAKLLDQKGCQYIPHVSGVQVGQKLQIRNSDPTLHNVHALAKVNREFNEGQPVQGMVSEKQFDKPEVMIRIKCDVHPWMNSYIGVVPHPYYAVSDEGGSFTIQGLPPGNYTLEAWHEKLGPQTQQITVAPSEVKTVSFTFNAT